MTETRALGAEHASLLCDRVAEHSRAQLAAFGNARGEFHENIIDVLRVEEESSASLSAAVTERLACMDARLANLALEHAEALRREMEAEVAEHERAAEAISRRIVRERVSFLERAREKLVAGENQPAARLGKNADAARVEKTHDDAREANAAIAAIDDELAKARSEALCDAFGNRETVFPKTTPRRDDSKAASRARRECVAAREDIDAIYRSATRTRARVRRDERDASLEETRAANRTLFVERRAKARVSSQRDLLAAMQGDRARYDAFAHDTAHTIDACDR